MKKLIDKLEKEHFLSKNEYVCLIENFENVREYAAKKARTICERVYGRDIYIRGLIEISSFCRNDCIYCGIRRSNKNAQRYRLSKEEILECCDIGYNLGFRTFVLQGGEDKFYTDEIIADIVRSIKKKYADCAVTLSLGEFPTESYALFKKAGADRYLLRHETADKTHYEKLHPKEMSFENRMRCLRDLKNLGNIINVASALGIGTTGQIEYDIDNKQQLENELYENAYKEALKKAQVILGKTDLNLKNPVTITDKSYGIIQP